MFGFQRIIAGIQEDDIPIACFSLLSGDTHNLFVNKLMKREVDFSGDVGYWVEFDYYIPSDVARKTDELPLSLYVAN